MNDWIGDERRALEHERQESKLDLSVEFMSCLPLDKRHWDAVAEHLTTLQWSDEQHAAAANIIITAALGGRVSAEDVACLLTRADVMSVIEEVERAR